MKLNSGLFESAMHVAKTHEYSHVTCAGAAARIGLGDIKLAGVAGV